MSIKFTFLPVYGEAILITAPKFVILVDGGKQQTQGQRTRDILIRYINELKRDIDLVILTHTDNDHIGGLIELLKIYEELPFKIKNIWFNTLDKIKFITNEKNTNKTSFPQAESFYELIIKNKLNHNLANKNSTKIDINTTTLPTEFSLSPSMNIKILSPTKESLDAFYTGWNQSKFFDTNNKTSARLTDYEKPLDELEKEKLKKDTKLPNGASIAFILSYENNKFLFTGDAFPEIISSSLKNIGYSEKEPLEVAFFKLPHHGSSYNINCDLIRLVKTRKYIVCAKGLNYLPHKKTFAYILKEKKEKIVIGSNICLKKINIFSKNELLKGNFSLEKIEEISFE